MRAFEPLFPSFIEDILSREHETGVEESCPVAGCKGVATVRCRECRQRAPLCKSHAVDAHRHLPFHWIEVWNGRYFVRQGLHSLGFVIDLGHNGAPCPERSTSSRPYDFTIVHDNGVHHVKIRDCHCADHLPFINQLVRADFFPATATQPETAFTREALRGFIVDFEISKKSAQDYVRRLVRNSEGEEGKPVKVRMAM